MMEKSLAWKIDNFTKGNSSSFINLTQSISENINALVNHSETLLVEEDTNERRKIKTCKYLRCNKEVYSQKQNSVESTKDFIENTGIKLEGRC